MQLIKVTKVLGQKGEVWINPEAIVLLEVGQKKEVPPGEKANVPFTVIHYDSKAFPKFFVSETPEEVNELIVKVKKGITIQV